MWVSPDAEQLTELGRKYLTWLWTYGEKHDWTIKFSTKSRVEYGIDDHLVLCPEDSAGCTLRLTGPVPTNTPEAKADIRRAESIGIV